MRNLGLDIGNRRIGVAISDPENILASPLTTIMNVDTESSINAILEIVNKQNVGGIVIGLPYSLNGNIGEQAKKVMAFIEKLSNRTQIGIHIQDERLSTIAANRQLKEAGNRGNKKREQLDAIAAAFILQGYIDSIKNYDQ